MAKKIFFLAFFILSINAFAEKQEMITLPAGPFVKKGAGLFITAEFLWWKGIQERLNYATTGVLIQPGTNITSPGKVHSVHSPWNPGFRIGMGFYPGHDGWDLYARYTWFHSGSTNHASNREGNMLPVSLFLGGPRSLQVNGVTTARSQWDLHYNVVDLELGRHFFFSKFLSARLFAGLRGTWNHQDWNTRYRSNHIIINGGAPLSGEIKTNQDQDTWGIGIRVGVNSGWTFCKGWSIVSDASFAGVWIDYDNKRRDSIAQTGFGRAIIANINSDPNSTLFNLDLMLGLRGEWWFCNERYHLSAQTGWENQVWLHYGNFILFNGHGNGDLTFSGLTAKLRFDF